MSYYRRATPRTEADDSVYAFWSSNDSNDLSRVRNLNMGGIFIETLLPKEPGASVDLYFLVHEGKIRANAVVRHKESGRGLGLKFTTLDDQDRLRFGALMKRLYSAHRAAVPA